MDKPKQIADSVEYGRIDQIEEEVAALLDEGVPMDSILQQGIMAGMREVGRKFAAQEYFLPEMLRAARTVKRVEQAFSRRSEAAPRYPEKVLLGTVKNDLHDIGKNLVQIAASNAGFRVVDLGVDVSAEQFVWAAEADEEIAFVGISALLTTTLGEMRRTVQALKASPAARRLTVFVGGAPVTAEFARTIGADVYTESAFEAAAAMCAIAEGRQPWTFIP